jgi:hypothetical protein
VLTNKDLVSSNEALSRAIAKLAQGEIGQTLQVHPAPTESSITRSAPAATEAMNLAARRVPNALPQTGYQPGMPMPEGQPLAPVYAQLVQCTNAVSNLADSLIFATKVLRRQERSGGFDVCQLLAQVTRRMRELPTQLECTLCDRIVLWEEVVGCDVVVPHPESDCEYHRKERMSISRPCAPRRRYSGAAFQRAGSRKLIEIQSFRCSSEPDQERVRFYRDERFCVDKDFSGRLASVPPSRAEMAFTVPLFRSPIPAANRRNLASRIPRLGLAIPASSNARPVNSAAAPPMSETLASPPLQIPARQPLPKLSLAMPMGYFQTPQENVQSKRRLVPLQIEQLGLWAGSGSSNDSVHSRATAAAQAAAANPCQPHLSYSALSFEDMSGNGGPALSAEQEAADDDQRNAMGEIAQQYAMSLHFQQQHPVPHQSVPQPGPALLCAAYCPSVPAYNGDTTPLQSSMMEYQSILLMAGQPWKKSKTTKKMVQKASSL